MKTKERVALLIALVGAFACGDDDGGDGSDGGNGGASRIVGMVTTDAGEPLPGARVTVSAGGDYVDETRSDDEGRYELGGLVGGDYEVGASSLRREYEEQQVALEGDEVVADFELGPETETGRWTTIGDTEPEYYAGTPSGTLLADGRVFYCHSTLDAVLVDPENGEKDFAIMSPSSQGCHMQTVLSDGRLLFVGGQNPEDPGSFTNGIPYVKIYDPAEDTWDTLDDLNEPRWYPTLVRLADERMLICGGGQPPDASRTETCEIWDPESEQATPTDSLSAPTEYSPSVLLYSGEVLTTWYPPQIYNADDEEWRATGNFVQSDRGFPDHSPHSLVMLPDGTPLAVGNIAGPGQIMVEAFDPDEETWSEKAAPDAHRSRPEVVLLPDGRVLAAGGKLEDSSDVPTNEWGQVALTDLYDPETDSWRELAPMALAREYHAMTLLVPDGRVLTTSGTSNQATGPTTENSVEAFEPPYLFRGIRPTIESLSTTELERGGTLQVEFRQTRAPTSVVLIGTSAVTHWMDGGVPRLLRLDVDVDGDTANVSLPDVPAVMPSGMYILFVFVDDIPSQGVIVTVPR
jgi:hypothetical protein